MKLSAPVQPFYTERQWCFSTLFYSFGGILAGGLLGLLYSGSTDMAMLLLVTVFLPATILLRTRVRSDSIRVRLGTFVPLAGFNIAIAEIKSLHISDDEIARNVRQGVYRGRLKNTRALYARGSGKSGIFVEADSGTYWIGSTRPTVLMDAILQTRIDHQNRMVAKSAS